MAQRPGARPTKHKRSKARTSCPLGDVWRTWDFFNVPPFRILTKEEDKLLEKHYRSIEKQVEEAFKKKK